MSRQTLAHRKSLPFKASLSFYFFRLPLFLIFNGRPNTNAQQAFPLCVVNTAPTKRGVLLCKTPSRFGEANSKNFQFAARKGHLSSFFLYNFLFPSRPPPPFLSPCSFRLEYSVFILFVTNFSHVFSQEVSLVTGPRLNFKANSLGRQAEKNKRTYTNLQRHR